MAGFLCARCSAGGSVWFNMESGLGVGLMIECAVGRLMSGTLSMTGDFGCRHVRPQ